MSVDDWADLLGGRIRGLPETRKIGENVDFSDLSPNCQILVIFFAFCIFRTLEQSTV